MKGQVEREVPAIIRTVVFSDGPGGGNPAPVFLYADSMTDRDMQEAAARLGEEAVFVLSPRRDDCAVRMRYFVPDHELSICAHDTIGAVTVLVEEGLLAGDGLLAGEDRCVLCPAVPLPQRLPGRFCYRHRCFCSGGLLDPPSVDACGGGTELPARLSGAGHGKTFLFGS